MANSASLARARARLVIGGRARRTAPPAARRHRRRPAARRQLRRLARRGRGARPRSLARMPSGPSTRLGVERPDGHARVEQRDQQDVVDQVAREEAASASSARARPPRSASASARGRGRCGGRRRGRRRAPARAARRSAVAPRKRLDSSRRRSSTSAGERPVSGPCAATSTLVLNSRSPGSSCSTSRAHQPSARRRAAAGSFAGRPPAAGARGADERGEPAAQHRERRALDQRVALDFAAGVGERDLRARPDLV